MRPAFFDGRDFPGLFALTQAWPAIRRDLDELRAPLMDVDRVGKPHAAVVAEVGQRVAAGEPFGWVKGWGGQGGATNPDWTQYGLVLGDAPIPFARALRTLALLSGLRGLKVAAFARLAPGTLLPSHTHPEIAAEGLLQAHITIKAPRPCASCLTRPWPRRVTRSRRGSDRTPISPVAGRCRPIMGTRPCRARARSRRRSTPGGRRSGAARMRSTH